MTERDRRSTRAGEQLAAPTVLLALVDELRIHPERDVVEEHPPVHLPDVHAPLGAPERVECRDRVVAVQPDVPREVIPSPERDADERQAALDRDRGDRCERAVATGHPERVGVGPSGDRLEVLSLAEEVHVDAPAACLVGELLARRAVAPGARIDDQEGGHGGPGYRPDPTRK